MLTKKFKKQFTQWYLTFLKDQGIIYEKDGKFYSDCALHEEITIELKPLWEEQ